MKKLVKVFGLLALIVGIIAFMFFSALQGDAPSSGGSINAYSISDLSRNGYSKYELMGNLKTFSAILAILGAFAVISSRFIKDDTDGDY